MTKAESDLSQALAHYAWVLVTAEESAANATNTLDHLKQAVELDPHCYRSHMLLGLACEKDKDFEAARGNYLAALKLEPRKADAYILLARLYGNKGDHEKAIEILNTALAKAEASDVILPFCNLLGNICLLKDHIDEAIAYLKLVAERDHENTRARMQLATCYLATNDRKSALRLLEDLSQEAGDDFQQCRELGFLFEKAEAFDKALKEYEKAVALIEKETEQRPDNSAAKAILFDLYDALGRSHLELGNKEKAILCLDRACKADPPRAMPFAQLALIYAEDKPEKAIEILDEAARILPEDLTIPTVRGCVLMSQERFSDAVAAFEKADKLADKLGIESKSLSPMFCFWYGSACERAGQKERAEELFEKCITLYPANHQAYNYLAYMWAEQGVKLDKALSYVNKSLEFEPNNGAYLDTLGWIYYKHGEHRKALEQVEKASKTMRDDPVILEHLGDINMAMTRKRKAVNLWKKSFLLSPSNKSVTEKLRAQAVNIDELSREVERTKKKDRTD